MRPGNPKKEKPRPGYWNPDVDKAYSMFDDGGAYRSPIKRERRKTSKTGQGFQVERVLADGTTERFDTATTAAKELGMDKGRIYHVILHGGKANGTIWRKVQQTQETQL